MAPQEEPRSRLTGDADPEGAANELAELISLHETKRRAHLDEQLTSLVFISVSLQSVGAGGPASQRAKDARSIESACGRILSAFAITGRDFKLEDALATSPIASVLGFQIAQIIRPDRHYHSPIVDDESRDRIAAILDGIVILRDAAYRAREQAGNQSGKGRGGKRRTKDWPLHEMAWHILRLYIELTGRRPTVTRSSIEGARTGPAVLFLDLALRRLGWDIKPNTAADLIDQLKDDEKLLKSLKNPIFKSNKS